MVPLLALGAALGGLALVILWRMARPLAPAMALLLVGSNILYLGFLTERFDGTSAWWPPTLSRYVYELFHDHTTGNEAAIALLGRLPPKTTVRMPSGTLAAWSGSANTAFIAASRTM